MGQGEVAYLKKSFMGDYLIMGGTVVTGLAEAAHLGAVLLDWPFQRCALVFGILLTVAAGLGTGLFFFLRKKRKDFPESHRPAVKGTEKFLYFTFAAVVSSQLIFICMGNNMYRGGDMTVETVGSFLAADGVYRVNPLTGASYTAGIPSRLKILCLPTLYASLCKITGLPASVIVWRVIPLVMLFLCYTAFFCVAGCLFPEQGREGGIKRAGFMLAAALLLWTGAYGQGMEGFQLLCCGWQGITIRNCVLLPWLLSLCLRKKWIYAIFCVLAEACMVWTLYGGGICLLFAAGMAGAGAICRAWSKKGRTRA